MLSDEQASGKSREGNTTSAIHCQVAYSAGEIAPRSVVSWSIISTVGSVVRREAKGRRFDSSMERKAGNSLSVLMSGLSE